MRSNGMTGVPILAIAMGVCATAHLTAEEPREGLGDGVLYEADLSVAPIVITGWLKLPHSSELVILDTGSSTDLILDRKLAATLGPPANEVVIKGLHSPTYQVPGSSLGELSIPPEEISSADLGVFRTVLGLPINGIVGWPALKGKTLILDYDQHKVRIVKGAYKLPDQKEAIPVFLDATERPQIRVDLGGGDVDMLLDTGSNTSMSLLPKDFDRLAAKGWIHLRDQTSKLTNLSGDHAVRTGWFTEGSLLGVSLKGIEVESTEDVNCIGLEFFAKLDLAISNEPSALSYKPRVNPEPPIAPAMMMGMIATFSENHATVAKIKPGRAAEKAGLKLGDEILGIDEVEDEKLSYVSLYRLCEKYAGKPVALRIRRGGEERKIVLTISAPISAWDTQAAVESGS